MIRSCVPSTSLYFFTDHIILEFLNTNMPGVTFSEENNHKMRSHQEGTPERYLHVQN